MDEITKELTAERLGLLSVPDLRKAAAERGIGSGIWRAGASKAALIEVLTGGAVPAPVPGPAAAPAPATIPAGPDRAPAAVPVDGGNGAGLAAAIAAAVATYLPPAAVNPEDVDARIAAALDGARAEFAGELDKIRAELAARPATVLDVSVNGAATATIDGAHSAVPALIKLLARPGRHVYLVGPAGSGKTTAAAMAARALGLEFGTYSVGEETSACDLLGFIDAGGRYVSTEFRRRYESGGVMLIDEIDSASPAALVVLNAALANGHCSFPDGMIRRHESFRLVAAANTYGTGANAVYVGRARLDGSTLDRFIYLEFPYDSDMERRAALAVNPAAGDWVDTVQRLRRRADEIGVKVIISPRASITGAGMLADGFTADDCASMLIWRGMSPETRAKLERD